MGKAKESTYPNRKAKPRKRGISPLQELRLDPDDHAPVQRHRRRVKVDGNGDRFRELLAPLDRRRADDIGHVRPALRLPAVEEPERVLQTRRTGVLAAAAAARTDAVRHLRRDFGRAPERQLVAREAEPLDVGGDDAHVVLERAGLVARGLQEHELGVHQKNHRRVHDVLGGIAVGCGSSAYFSQSSEMQERRT